MLRILNFTIPKHHLLEGKTFELTNPKAGYGGLFKEIEEV